MLLLLLVDVVGFVLPLLLLLLFPVLEVFKLPVVLCVTDGAGSGALTFPANAPAATASMTSFSSCGDNELELVLVVRSIFKRQVGHVC